MFSSLNKIYELYNECLTLKTKIFGNVVYCVLADNRLFDSLFIFC